jgi:hypothetical protein
MLYQGDGKILSLFRILSTVEYEEKPKIFPSALIDMPIIESAASLPYGNIVDTSSL